MAWQDEKIENPSSPDEKVDVTLMRLRVEALFKKVVIGEVDKRNVELTPQECGIVKDLIVVVKRLWT